MAALMPQTTPWNRALRGSSDGVKARQAKASATQAPGRVYRNRRRPTAPSEGGPSGFAAPPSAVSEPSATVVDVWSR
jgi:hypothetical protein